jgi:CheY-like chemotaxis protein
VAEVDHRQIEQVLLNLFVNAWQAMPDGGELYLETSTANLEETPARSKTVPSGPYGKISVTDTGMGMDDATRKQIFDPFFTTKDKGRGTGLGLASAYGIVKNHGGMITVHSEVGQGTTFDIYLPLTDKEAHRDDAKEDGWLAGSETVLLVDDERMIIDVSGPMLEKLGYRVVIAQSGQEAVDVVSDEERPLDLVILDLVMPGMDGRATFDRIRRIRPELPVLLSSGYAVNSQATEILHKGCEGFIQKPFNINELSRKIREILWKSH